MRSLKIFLVALIIPLMSFAALHKYYVSVTEIEYSKKDSALQITSRIFIDDFEKLLQERYDDKIKLSKTDELKTVNLYIEKYLKEKLEVKVNGQIVAFNFIGKEYEDDLMFCYLEVENVTHISSIQVINHVLFDIYPEQQNIVRFKVNSKNKSVLLTKENDKGLLNF